MKCTFKNLSDEYQQAYVTFSKEEVEDIFYDIESTLDIKSLQMFHSDDEFFKEKFYETVIDIIEDELAKQEVIIMSQRIYNIMSVIRRDKPLVVTVGYCIYDEYFDFLEFNLKIEKKDFKKISPKYLKEVMDLIMLQKGYYRLVKNDIVTKESEVGFFKISDGIEKEEIIFPNDENLDFHNAFIGAAVDDVITYKKNKYQLTSIRKRKILELDDRIASLIDPWNGKTAKDFIEHIREVEQFYSNVAQTIKVFIEMLLEKELITWDQFTVNHYLQMVKTEPYKISGQTILKIDVDEVDDLTASLTEQTLCAYVMSRNNTIHFRNEDKVKKINQLYFLKYGLVKGLEDTNDLVNTQALKVLIYEFLEDVGIIV